jgi:hypothetical protein
MNPRQINFPDILKEWLDREKANSCWRSPKVINSWQPVFAVFNAHPPPDVPCRPGVPEFR